MISDWFPFAILGLVLVLGVASMALWRRAIASHEDDTLHVLDNTGAIPHHQLAISHRLEVIDWWGEILTIVAVVYLLAMAGIYAYQYWIQASSLK
jgi:hypothetical protein